MINNRRRVLAAKYFVFVLLFLLLYVLQTTPGFLSLKGLKPILLISASMSLAMYEGEFIGGLFGLLAGLLCDLGSFSLYGLYSVLLLCCCTACGLVVIYLMRRTIRVAFLLTFAAATVCALLRFYFDYGLWGYDSSARIFWVHTVPGIAYTAAFTPVFFYLFGWLEEFFESKISI